MKKRYVVKLTSEERGQLERIVNRGRKAAYRRRHAQVLLLIDEGEQGPDFFIRVRLNAQALLVAQWNKSASVV